MGLLTNIKLWAAARRYGPARETLAYPKLQALFGQNRSMGSAKPSPANLRYFSRTVYARRAINAIKNPVAALEWEIVPIGKPNKTLQAQADLLARCFDRPNHSDSARSLIEQLIEDALVTGAGVAEIGISTSDRPLWLWPVDATTVRPVIGWDGRPRSVRFLQSQGYTGASILSDVNAKRLEAQDILYCRMNPASDSPYGFGPLEIAYASINRQLGVGRYAANLASNAQPQNLIYVGQATTTEEILAFRNYWRNEVEGQGQTPIIANTIKPDVLKLHAGGDEALYLKWQAFLIREIATAFGISPQNLGLESDVNRNTSEVAEDRDWDASIKPMAHLIEAHITRDVLAKFGPFEFRFTGLDREDEKATSAIYATYYQGNVLTPNEQRERMGLQPLKSPWADLCWADVQIAMKGAQGAKQIDDNQLPAPNTAGATGEPENGS